MKMDVELLEITKDNQEEAQFMASSFVDDDIKNRVYLNVSGSEAVSNHLERFGINVTNVSSIHSIKRVIQNIDIADIILPNIHIDVRVIFDDKKIFIPKAHFELGIVPDIYVVLKYVNSTERIYLLGFFEPSAVEFSGEDDKYYFIDSSNLRSPFEMIEFIRDFKHKTEVALTQEQVLRGRELSVRVSDHDITDEEFKEFLGLLLKSNVLRSSVLEYDNFETLALKVAEALRVKISKKVLGSSVVGIDEFMDLDSSDNSDIVSDSHEVTDDNTPPDDDINGDKLLDSEVLPNSDIEEDVAIEGDDSANIIDENISDPDFVEDQGDIDTGNLDIGSQDESDLLLDEYLGPESDIAEKTNEKNSELPDIDIQDIGNVKTANSDEEQDILELENFLTDEHKSMDTDYVSEEQAGSEAAESVIADSESDTDCSGEKEIPGEIRSEVTQAEYTASNETKLDSVQDDNVSEIIDEEKNESDGFNDFSLDENIFDTKGMDLDFSGFEENMSGEAANNFMNEENIPEKLISKEDVAENNLDYNSINEALEVEESPQNQELIQEGIESDVKEEDISNMNENTEDLSKKIVSGENQSNSQEDSHLADLINIPDDNLDLDIKDFEDIAVNSNGIDDITKLDLPEEEELVSFSDLSGVNESVAGEPNSENIDNGGELLSDIMTSKLGENAEILRNNDSGLSQDDEFFSDDLIDFPSESATDDVVDIAPEELSITDNELNDDAKVEESDDDIANEEMVPSASGEPIDISDNDLFKTDNISPEEDAVPVAEVSFDAFESLEDIETVSPEGQNLEVDFTDGEIENMTEENVVAATNSVTENSVVISDKNSSSGEIFIDINKDSSKSEFEDNEHLEELYNASSGNDDSGLNNGVRIVPQKTKSPIPLIAGIGGLAVFIVIAGIIAFFGSKYVTPSSKEANVNPTDKSTEQSNLGTDVPRTTDSVDKGKVVMDDTQGLNNKSSVKESDSKVDNKAKAADKNVALSQIPSTAFLSVSKLTWEVPDYISYNEGFKQYFQSSGKSIKSALTSDLLLAKDYTYSDQIRVSVSFDKSGNFVNSKILLSSGSAQVDNIVLQSVNQTLKVLKAPGSLGNDQGTTVILKIYL